MTRSWTLEFYDVADGDDLGTVTFDAATGALTADSAMVQEIVEGHSADELLEQYNGWSNGYVSSRLQGEKRTMPQGGVRVPTAAEQKKAMKNFLETNRYVDPSVGEEYKPAGVPPDPTPGTEEDGGTPSPQTGI
jgi:hypothetical protein